MGMASSQVRLLMITNRMHDIEYKAQCLQNAKILLGQLEDDAYQNFLAAQEGANTITIGGKAAQSTFMLSDLVTALGVGLKGPDGKIHVTQDFLDNFKTIKQAQSENEYRDFVWLMKGNSLGDIPQEPKKEDYTNIEHYTEWVANPSGVSGASGPSGYNVDKTRENFNEDGYKDALAIYNSYISSGSDGTYRQLFDLLSKEYETDPTLKNVDGNMSATSMEELADMITNGGYELINKNALGRASYDRNGENEAWNTVIDTNNPFNYSVATGRDEAKIAKASAEYEMELRKIDRKEKQYDTELAKLESERQALDKEREGIKKVMEDNIDRTFGLFS